jgi:hypothetical protein
MAVAVLLLLAALGPVLGGPAVPRRVAVVIGVSAYDPATRVPQLPGCETSARALAAVLDSQAETRALIRRVPASAMLDAIRAAGAGCGRDDLFLVFVICAGDDQGLVASDRRVGLAELRKALDACPARHRALCVDAAGGARLVAALGRGETVALASTGEGQHAWSRFFPYDEVMRFEQAASHGWRRAMERVDASWKGDLGSKDGLDIEDLRMCGDEEAEQSLPDREGRLPLDADLTMPILRAVRPSSAARLDKGRSVAIDDLRKDLGEVRFTQLAGVIAALGSDDLRTASAAIRRGLTRSVEGKRPMAALQTLHDRLLHDRLLDTPSDGETRLWKRLERERGGGVVVVRPEEQSASFRGRADIAILGPSHHVRFRVPYGRYEGEGSGGLDAHLRVDILGGWFHGRWEGEMNGKWLRGDWQGRWDARRGRIEGRVVSRLEPEGGGEKAPRDTVWPAMFEGKVTEEGAVVSGTWRSLAPERPAEGHWRARK